jgi:hypothetical protein
MRDSLYYMQAVSYGSAVLYISVVKASSVDEQAELTFARAVALPAASLVATASAVALPASCIIHASKHNAQYNALDRCRTHLNV